jgi:hypothetical protein
MFFFPMGGIFMFGDGGNKTTRVIMGFINLIMGAITLAIGYAYDLPVLVVFGYIIGGLGLIMMLLNMFKRETAENERDESGTI